ncbi:hypothetical protein [uncultured Peptoniphilus sp.]|uniref:hypothetical protein n=1 Tax=uncultured Peptoniphilus sp. TaxID=254354 RepID=UPI0025D78EAC|nr:hypothetical protein [uncultured Peptoniphilus sp.]
MKDDKKEIYEIGKKVIYQSTIGFENLIKKAEFDLLRENSYLMKRPQDNISAFILLDFKEFYYYSKDVLRNILTSLDLEDPMIENMEELLRDSYVSLFKIEKKDGYYLFYDYLLDEYIEVELDDDIEYSSSTKGLIRVFGKDERKMVLQVLQMISNKDFLTYKNNVDNLINHMRQEFGPFELNKDFLKSDLLNLLTVYEVTFENPREESEDFDDYAFSEFAELLESFDPEDLEIAQNLDLYKKILPGAKDEAIMGFIVRLFSKIYFKVLADKNKRFDDYKLDYKEIFKSLSKSGEFLSKDELVMSLDYLITFYSKLAGLGRDVGKIITDLIEIQENIFYYLDLLKNNQAGLFYEDKILEILMANEEDLEANDFIEYFDFFIEFLDMNYVGVLKSGDLSPAMLRDFAESINLRPTREVMTYKNKHFPLIELYFNFLKKKHLIHIDQKEYGRQDIYITDIAEDYLAFDEVTKLAIWVETLTNKDFLKDSFGKDYEKYKDFVTNLIKDLSEGKLVNLYEFKFKDFELSLIEVLKDLGILKDDFTDLTITKFGRDIYDYYKTEEANSDNVIEVDFK